MQAAKILVRKLSSVGYVDAALLFLNKLLDVDYNVDRITYTAFLNGCYENDRYALAADLSERILKRVRGKPSPNCEISQVRMRH